MARSQSQSFHPAHRTHGSGSAASTGDNDDDEERERERGRGGRQTDDIGEKLQERDGVSTTGVGYSGFGWSGLASYKQESTSMYTMPLRAISLGSQSGRQAGEYVPRRGDIPR